MADRFDQFHVPQQSRRDKLRVVHNHHHQNCEDDHVTTTTTLDASSQGAFLPLYDPSFFPPDILTCSNTTLKQHNPTPPVYVKEEGPGPLPPNFMMSYVINNNNNMTTSTTSASSSSSSHHHQPPYNTNLLDPNPTAIHHHHPDNNPPFLYTVQNLRGFDQSFHQQQVLPSRTMPSVQALSLSLSSHHNHQQQQHQKQQTLPLELNLPSYGCGVRGGIIDSAGASTSSIDVRNSVPLGPFTGYASILKGSRFLKPAKQLLDELCDVGRGVYFDTTSADSSSLMDFSMDSEIVDAPHVSSNDRASAHRQKKSRLISMLDEVYRRYKLYYQQMQAIVASFESVAGLGDAAPYTSFALKAMSKHFNCLKNAITDQLRSTNKILGEGSHSKDEAQRFEAADRWAHGQRVVQSLSYIEHQHQPVWRPQRGLPERAVSVLRAWLFEHFLHPYPTDTDKQMLAKQTGLSRSQVSNWFINARVRLWKPMVEEIHMLETRQSQKASDVEERNSSKSDDILPTPNADKQPQISCPLNIQNQTLKRSRTELHLPEKANEASSNLMYSNFSNQQHIGGGVSTSGGNSGVSLTLGLRQNNGIGLSESFPINIAHQFGLEASNQGYVIGSFATPNRHFGKDVGGQLFHDFVG